MACLRDGLGAIQVGGRTPAARVPTGTECAGVFSVGLDGLLEKQPLRTLRTAVATIRAVGFVIAIVGSGAAIAYLRFGRDGIQADVAVTSGIALAALTATVTCFGWYTKYIYNPRFYDIVELNALLVVEPAGDHHHYVYTRRQLIHARHDEFRLVEIRAHWTGASSRESNPRVESLINGHVLLDGKEPEEDGHVHRWIYTRQPIRRGQQVEVGVRQVHEDDLRRQLPYFRDGGGRYRTRKLTVTARFPKNHDPRMNGEIEGRVWNSNRPIHRSPVSSISVTRKMATVPTLLTTASRSTSLHDTTHMVFAGPGHTRQMRVMHKLSCRVYVRHSLERSCQYGRGITSGNQQPRVGPG